MRSKIKVILICLFLFILLITTSNIWLPVPGTYLAVKDDIKNADCIVPLEGDLYFRFKKAVELHNKGYSKNIVVSVLPKREEKIPGYHNLILRIYGLKDVSQKEFALMTFKYFDKGQKDIYFTDYEVTSTYEEALATRDFMLKKGFKSLILVTTTYHMRRALMIFKSVFKGTGIKIYHAKAGKELFNPGFWWRKERDIKAIADEYLAIMQNFIYHTVLKKKRTAFDSYY